MTPPPELMKAPSPGRPRCGLVKAVRLRSMPVPYLIAAKAGTVVGMARSALAEWNRLDAETKRHLQREASDVRERLFEVAAALGARLRDSSDEDLTWGDARSLALTPRADFVLAREIPAILLGRPTSTTPNSLPALVTLFPRWLSPPSRSRRPTDSSSTPRAGGG